MYTALTKDRLHTYAGTVNPLPPILHIFTDTRLIWQTSTVLSVLADTCSHIFSPKFAHLINVGTRQHKQWIVFLVHIETIFYKVTGTIWLILMAQSIRLHDHPYAWHSSSFVIFTLGNCKCPMVASAPPPPKQKKHGIT